MQQTVQLKSLQNLQYVRHYKALLHNMCTLMSTADLHTALLVPNVSQTEVNQYQYNILTQVHLKAEPVIRAEQRKCHSCLQEPFAWQYRMDSQIPLD